MKVEKKYYVIGMYDNNDNAWYYYVERHDDKIILTKNVEQAMKASSSSICYLEIEGILRHVETCYIFNAIGDRINCTKYCLQDDNEFNMYMNEIELANSISVKSVSAEYNIDNIIRRI